MRKKQTRVVSINSIIRMQMLAVQQLIEAAALVNSTYRELSELFISGSKGRFLLLFLSTEQAEWLCFARYTIDGYGCYQTNPRYSTHL